MAIFFQTELFQSYLLPFLLVFTILFAVLDRTKVLGDDKRQINAIVSLVAGLILLAFPASKDLIVKIIPLMLILLIILFVFLLLFSFVSGAEKDPLHKNVKVAIGVVIAFVLAIAILVFTGNWDKVYNSITGQSNVVVNIIFIIIIIAAIIAVVFGAGKSGDKH